MNSGPTTRRPGIYGSLQKIREHERQAAQRRLTTAEEERDRTFSRIQQIQDQVLDARGSVDASDVESVALYNSFRLQQALSERREEARLVQNDRELELRRTQHRGCVVDELSLDALIQRMDDREQSAERHADAVRMDEIAARRRRT